MILVSRPPQPQTGLIWCGTGHRPQKIGLTEEKAVALAELIGLTLREEKPSLVMSGMALGFDQVLCLACLQAGVPYEAVVPFPGQADPWLRPQQVLWRYLLAQAARVHTLSPGPYRPALLHARNSWMVDRADRVLALWDGSPGGTGTCITYARKKGKRVFNLWEVWKGIYDVA